MNKENKLIPGLPSGFEDRWNKKLLLKKRLLRVIEKNFIKYGFDPLETPSFEISENIGSFLAEDENNPMSDVFTFDDGEKNITLRYDLSSPLARFVAQNNQELPSIYSHMLDCPVSPLTTELALYYKRHSTRAHKHSLHTTTLTLAA